MEKITRSAEGYCLGARIFAVGDVVELRIYGEFRRGRVVTDPELGGWGVAFEDASVGLTTGFVARLISAQAVSTVRKSLGCERAAIVTSPPKLLAADKAQRSRAR